METYRQTDVREIEDILRRIEAAENAGNSSEIADMLAEDAVIPRHRESRRSRWRRAGAVTCREQPVPDHELLILRRA